MIEKLTIAVVRRVAVPGCSPGAMKAIQFNLNKFTQVNRQYTTFSSSC